MTNGTTTPKESPLACDMSAIKRDQRKLHIALASHLLRSATDIRELPNGYSFCLPGEMDTLLKAAEFVSLERLCCPFLGFAIEVESEGGPVSLRMIGREGVKAFIREEVNGLLGNAINWTLVESYVEALSS